MKSLVVFISITLMACSVISWGFSAYYFTKLFRSGYGFWLPEVVFFPILLPPALRSWRIKWLWAMALWIGFALLAAICQQVLTPNS